MADKPNIGYSDTPVIAGESYCVHDGSRPQPRVVTPGDAGSPPSDAVVLFDGRDASGWVSVKDGSPCGWKVADGVMEVVPGTGDMQTREQFGDCQLHVEWAAPAEVVGESQGRGNSGVFLMGRYEIQVLDGYQNPTYADGITAAIYGQFPPLVNACREPGAWQTYDIVWVAPRFEGEQLASPARVTVIHNGIVVHHDRALYGTTTHRDLPAYAAHPPAGPLKLQDHTNPVRYRNIWYRPLTGYDAG
jgi:hypothetical protein